MDANEAFNVVNGNSTILEDGTVSKTNTPSAENTAVPADSNPSKVETEIETTHNDSEKVNSGENNVPPEDSKKTGKPDLSKKTHTEKLNHQFKVLKDKQKYLKNLNDNLNSELGKRDEKIKELQAKLDKYSNLKKDDFKSEDSYLDYKFDMENTKRELKDVEVQKENLKEEYEKNGSKIQSELYSEKLNNNFSEAEISDFKNLTKAAEEDYTRIRPDIGVSKFSDLLKSETDLTVAKYLSDSENGPKLLRHFIKKPETMLKIMNYQDPMRKIMELKGVENAMVKYYSSKAEQRKLPETGLQIKNSRISDTTNFDHKWSAQDAFNYLRKK